MTDTETFFAPTSPADQLKTELIDMIRTRDYATPRHRQVELGPSEVAHPCMRKMAYGLMDAPQCNAHFDPLPSIIGVATHSWLESAARYANLLLEEHGEEKRWLAETRVNVATGLAGSCDLYDKKTHTVLDWKGLHTDTAIPTPNGWSTMGELSVGDTIFDMAGQPVMVNEISPIFERDCYRIIFEDGISIICDSVHEWMVQYGQDAINRLMTTPEMSQKLRNRAGASQIRIANPEPLNLPDVNLPIEPYLLGAWIGDGESNSGRIGKPDAELFEHISVAGSELGSTYTREDGLIRQRITGLTKLLRDADLIGNKHIPPAYLRASREQRISLLQGLMDTDGSWNKIRNQAIFCTNHKNIANDVAELITTLGWKPRVWELQKTGFDKTITAYDVTFIPFNDNPFRLSRKASLVRIEGTTRSRRRFIKSIERTLTVPTKCITVNSPTQTFLCTEAMIPTHNCPGMSRFDKYRKTMNPVYRTQVHFYGKGFINAGLPVDTVAIFLLPRGGTLANSHLWSEPYDEGTVQAALAKRDAVITFLHDFQTEQKPETFEWFPKSGPDCEFCPWFSPKPTSPLMCGGVT